MAGSLPAYGSPRPLRLARRAVPSSDIDETAVLSDTKKSLPTVGRRLGGRVIAKQPGPGRLPTVSDCLAGRLYHRDDYPSFAGVSSVIIR